MAHCDIRHLTSGEGLRTTLQSRFKVDRTAPSGVANLKGKHLGYRRKDGYWILRTTKGQLLAHRVVWELTHGPIPDGMVIDHINRNPSDNRIENLRCVTQAVNLTNVPVRSHCKSGEKYVNFEPRTGRWQLRIKRKSYGTFDTIAEAVALRDSL